MTTLIDILKGTNVNPKIARRKLRAAAKTKGSPFSKHETRTSWTFNSPAEVANVRKILALDARPTKKAKATKARKTA